jgi:Uma2 family endonuclease
MSTAYRFSVADYERMIESGVFPVKGDIRTELIYGEVRKMSPPNPPHEDTVDILNYWSVDVTPRDKIRVRVQNSLGIPEFDSVPEPDIAWMRVRDDYRTRRPQASDVLLLIEVSESTLAKDRIEKGRLYAEAEIAEYWIVNLIDGCLEVYRDPQEGVYRTSQILTRGEQFSPLCLPDAWLQIDRALGC